MAKHLIQRTDKWGRLMFDPKTNKPIMVRARVDEEDINEGQVNPQPSSVGYELSAAANPSMSALKKEEKKKGK